MHFLARGSGDDHFHIGRSAHATAHFVIHDPVLKNGRFLSLFEQSKLRGVRFFEADARRSREQGSEAFRAALKVGFGMVAKLLVRIFDVLGPLETVADQGLPCVPSAAVRLCGQLGR